MQINLEKTCNKHYNTNKTYKHKPIIKQTDPNSPTITAHVSVHNAA